MKLSNKKVYPVSYKFEMFLVDNNILRESGADLKEGLIFDWLANEAPGPMDAILVSTAKTMLETLGEYEHGTAEITTLFDEVSCEITVLDSTQKLNTWSKRNWGVTEPQEQWAINMEKAMLMNLCAIYSDLLLMMIAKAK